MDSWDADRDEELQVKESEQKKKGKSSSRKTGKGGDSDSSARTIRDDTKNRPKKKGIFEKAVPRSRQKAVL